MFKVRIDIVYKFPSDISPYVNDTFAYNEPTLYESILSEVNPSLVHLKKLFIAQVNVHSQNNESYSTRQNFVSHKKHSDMTAESLSELWHIGPNIA